MLGPHGVLLDPTCHRLDELRHQGDDLVGRAVWMGVEQIASVAHDQQHLAMAEKLDISREHQQRIQDLKPGAVEGVIREGPAPYPPPNPTASNCPLGPDCSMAFEPSRPS